MENLYFIAVVPPQDIRDEINKIKSFVSLKFESNHALRSPAHITLHMPFKWKERNMNQLFDKLSILAENTNGFNVELKNYGCFKPRVIYINVIPSIELGLLYHETKKVMKGLNIFNADYKEKPFQPHLTIAFRDLKKRLFEEAWNYFKNEKYNSVFNASEITLFKHNGKLWQIDKLFKLVPPN